MRDAIPTVDTDILIIGGGSAGTMAAITAKERNPHQDVVIFEKSQIKYSGNIARGMDALNVVAIPGLSTPEDFVRQENIICEGILDEPVAYETAARSFALLKKLESWGVCFPPDEKGDYQVLKVHQKGNFVVVMKEPELKTMLAKRVQDAGVRVINRTMAVRLLKDGDAVVGALGMNVRTGEFIACRAKAVILTAGGNARFGLPNSGYLYGTFDFPGNTGDGYILAYRAGAGMSGFEYNFIPYVVKDMNVPLLYITLTRGSRVFNAFGGLIDKDNIRVLPMLEEHMNHRGPLTINMSHLPDEKIREVEDILFTTERPVQERFFAGRGVNFRSGDIELWPTECHLCGGHAQTGIRVNERAETGVPGLYAAGDTALVARGHLSGAFVYGEIAAENATEYCAGRGPVSCDRGQIDSFVKDTARRFERGHDGPSIEEFEYKVRRLINDYVIPPKNAYKLDRGLWWMDRFREQVREDVRVRDVHDLFKVFEVENIIECATLSATASRERKESRWGLWHYRSDHPTTNDAEWLRHVVLTSGEHPGEVDVAFEPIRKMDSGVS